MIRKIGQAFVLDTAHTTYAFSILPGGHPEHLYYGRTIHIEHPDDLEILVEKHVFAPGNVNICEKEHAGFSLEDVRRCNQGRTSGRPHFARALVELGYAGSIQDAFEKYLATPAFYAEAERPKPSPEKGIAVIRQAGGVAVLAHPHQLKLEGPELEALLQQLISLGLQGIEAHYSRHTAEQTRLYLQLAEKYGLLVTSGSDFHGPSVKPDIQLGSGVAGSLCVEDGEIPRRLAQAIAANSALA